MRKKFLFSLTAVIALLFCTALGGCGLSAAFRYKNADKYSAGDGEISEEISALDIEWISGEVTLLYGNVTSVSFVETANRTVSESEQIHYWLDGGTLRLKFAESGLRYANNLSKTLTVALPLGLVLDSLSVKTVSADLNASVFAKKAQIETVSGDIDLSHAEITQKAEFESVSGDVNVCFSSMPEKLKSETVSGDTVWTFPKQAQFTLEFDTVSGDFTCEFDVTAVQRGKYVCGDGTVSCSVDSVSGDLYIRRAAYDAA